MSVLSPNTKYFWRVKSMFGKVESPWSETWSFTTASVNGVELLADESLNISPNPANGFVRINYNFNYQDAININIYDASGALVLTFANHNATASSQFDISNLAGGSYRLVFEIGDRKIVRNLTVIK